jgi:hypothetical protein
MEHEPVADEIYLCILVPLKCIHYFHLSCFQLSSYGKETLNKTLVFKGREFLSRLVTCLSEEKVTHNH